MFCSVRPFPFILLSEVPDCPCWDGESAGNTESTVVSSRMQTSRWNCTQKIKAFRERRGECELEMVAHYPLEIYELG